MISWKSKKQISEPPSRMKQLAIDSFALLVLVIGLVSILYVYEKIGDPYHKPFTPYSHNE